MKYLKYLVLCSCIGFVICILSLCKKYRDENLALRTIISSNFRSDAIVASQLSEWVHTKEDDNTLHLIKAHMTTKLNVVNSFPTFFSNDLKIFLEAKLENLERELVAPQEHFPSGVEARRVVLPPE